MVMKKKIPKKKEEKTVHIEVFKIIFLKLYYLLGRYHFYDEVAESQDEMDNPQEDEDYIDFRTYPLAIDWQEIENEKSDAYSIYDKYGYFGVSVFSTLSNVPNLKLTKLKFVKNIVDYYYKLFSKFQTNNDGTVVIKLAEFIDNLPDLYKMRQMFYQGLISRKEITTMKVILDLYEHYYMNFDASCKLLNDYLPTAVLFYSTLSDEDLAFIQEKLSQMKEVYEVISK
jgi:hypothetical protein